MSPQQNVLFTLSFTTKFNVNSILLSFSSLPTPRNLYKLFFPVVHGKQCSPKLVITTLTLRYNIQIRYLKVKIKLSIIRPGNRHKPGYFQSNMNPWSFLMGMFQTSAYLISKQYLALLTNSLITLPVQSSLTHFSPGFSPHHWPLIFSHLWRPRYQLFRISQSLVLDPYVFSFQLHSSFLHISLVSLLAPIKCKGL